MDKVRFGRALGYGARHAAKALGNAVDAATTPSPTTQKTPIQQAAHTTQAAKTHGKAAFGGFFAQLKRLSGVLWLQVTGTFFAIFAIFLGQGVWHLRTSFHSSPTTPEAQKLYLYLMVFLVFMYFTISSFLRAIRKEASKGLKK